MKTSFEAKAGLVQLEGTKEFNNQDFGYTLFEEVIDPENPEGPRAIAMHMPAHSISKVWELIEPGYEERVELLSGTASLVLSRFGTEDWTTMPLTPENPTADDVVIERGDYWCIVTEEGEAVVLSRPSKPFDISFEVSITQSPNDALSQFVLAHVASE